MLFRSPITWEALCFIRWKVLNDEDFRRNNVKKDFYFKSLLPANKIYTWQDYFRFYEDDYGRKFENDSFYKEIKKENIKFICRERDWYYNIWQNNVKVRNSEAAIEYGGFKVESNKEFTDDLEVSFHLSTKAQ